MNSLNENKNYKLITSNDGKIYTIDDNEWMNDIQQFTININNQIASFAYYSKITQIHTGEFIYLDNECNLNICDNNFFSTKNLGKFNNQEELEKAYQELEKKFSNDKKTTANKEAKGEISEDKEQTDTTPEETAEKNNDLSEEELKNKFNELPESDTKMAVSNAIKSMNEGTELTDEAFEAFESLGIPKELVTQHQELVKFKQEAEVTSLMNLAGGEEGYHNLTKWAQTNLSPEEVKVFDNIVDKGTVEEVSFAISNLHARYEALNQAPKSNLIKADAIVHAEGGYQSQAELQVDINSPEYETNPAFRDKVQAKLKRSKF